MVSSRSGRVRPDDVTLYCANPPDAPRAGPRSEWGKSRVSAPPSRSSSTEQTGGSSRPFEQAAGMCMIRLSPNRTAAPTGKRFDGGPRGEFVGRTAVPTPKAGNVVASEENTHSLRHAFSMLRTIKLASYGRMQVQHLLAALARVKAP